MAKPRLKKVDWPLGLPVIITKAVKEPKYDGAKARVVGYEAIKIFGFDVSTPVLQITGSKKLLRGYECWWIPQSEAESVTA